MSHELRTPLNSILVLAQQLGDDPEHNLTPKQVEFARTVHGAGTDLIANRRDLGSAQPLISAWMNEKRPAKIAGRSMLRVRAVSV
jgi:signal transduction histidine kinase